MVAHLMAVVSSMPNMAARFRASAPQVASSSCPRRRLLLASSVSMPASTPAGVVTKHRNPHKLQITHPAGRVSSRLEHAAPGPQSRDPRLFTPFKGPAAVRVTSAVIAGRHSYSHF